MDSMRVLILGAVGHVGNNLVRRAIKNGWEVVVFDGSGRRRRPHKALEGLDVEITPGNPGDPDALRQAMAGCQVVFHTNRYIPPNSLFHARRLVEAREYIGVVLKAAAEAHIGRLVYTSSVSTIGRSDIPGTLPDEWNHYRLGSIPHPFWDTQLVQEEAVLAFGRQRKIPVVILNLAELIGPHNLNHPPMEQLLDIAKYGKRDYIPGKTSIADVRDVAKGHIAAALEGRPGERYILGGHNITRREMVAIMAFASKRPQPDRPVDVERLARITRFSEKVSCFGRPNRPFPAGYQVAVTQYLGWYESGKARNDLGYTNRPFLKTCQSILVWLKTRGLLR
ncbi:MAG: NAD-dependent epimerase/dehydratase family protein [Anaerolineales bacterium]|nr:NAD-dependent epimerase/dehydratase family protein [Anaerolineales bacterium]